MRREFCKESGEYTPLNWLQSTNLAQQPASTIQYIDTGVKLSDNYIRVCCKLMFVDGVGGVVVGGRDNNGGFQLQSHNYYRMLRLYNGTDTFDTPSNIISKNTDYEIEAVCDGASQSITYNGITVSTNKSSLLPLTCANNIGMFASIRTGTIIGDNKIKIYWLQIYGRDGNKVRDFLPMLRTNDGKPGMMDLVENVFYTLSNPNASEFLYG
jgi:hypothetical protein